MTNQQRIQIMEEKLRNAFAPIELTITDDSHKHIGHPGAESGAGHFSLIIKSEKFKDKSSLESHKQIYKLLDELIPDEVHALKIKVLN